LRRPNILLIQTDQQKASSLDLYNRDVNYIKTEHISQLAEEGVVFDNTYCPYPLCVPSRTSMMCGQYPSTTGYIGNEPCGMAGKKMTLFDLLKSVGYRTMLVGKDHAYGLPRPGANPAEKWTPPKEMKAVFDDIYTAWHGMFHSPDTNRDCPKLEPFLQAHDSLSQLWGAEVAPWSTDETQTAAICNAFIDLAGKHSRSSSQPFACWLSISDPHEPYQAPRDMYERMEQERIGFYPNRDSDFSNRAEYMQFFQWFFNAGGPIPEEDELRLIKVYLAMCKNVDLQLGRVFDFLKKKGLWEDTLVIFTSDHGDLTGEHRLLQKFNCTYNGSAKVPLIVSWPGRTQGQKRVKTPVNLVDLPATICSLLGIDPLPDDQGMDLSPALLRDRVLDKKYTVIESGVPGPGLTCKDIQNFSTHKYNIIPKKRNAYDPPHRYAGRTYAVCSERYKLITREGQCNELYNVEQDPWEIENLAQKPDMKEVVEEHLLYLVKHLTDQFVYPADTKIAPQDALYPLGGDKSWDECAAED